MSANLQSLLLQELVAHGSSAWNRTRLRLRLQLLMFWILIRLLPPLLLLLLRRRRRLWNCLVSLQARRWRRRFRAVPEPNAK